jgi:hypothetical protein
MAKNKNRKQPQQERRTEPREQEQQDPGTERPSSPADVARKSKKANFGHN